MHCVLDSDFRPPDVNFDYDIIQANPLEAATTRIHLGARNANWAPLLASYPPLSRALPAL